MAAQLPANPDLGNQMMLGGIKFSEPQTRVAFAADGGEPAGARVLGTLAANNINLTQLFMGGPPVFDGDFCIEERDHRLVSLLLASSSSPMDDGMTAPGTVGSVTIFPHRSDPRVVFAALSRLAQVNLPIYSAYTSLSALCITTDYRLMDAVAESLLRIFVLPAGHSPFRYEPSEFDAQVAGAQGRKVETAARYRESVIKIYGSHLQTGVRSLSLSFPAATLSRVASRLAEAESMGSFVMVALTSCRPQRYALQLLVAPPEAGSFSTEVVNELARIPGVEVVEQSVLEVLYFHGPHFQDRHGVANTVVTTLAGDEVGFICLNCSGTSIYLVTSEGVGCLAGRALAKVFVVPSGDPGSSCRTTRNQPSSTVEQT